MPLTESAGLDLAQRDAALDASRFVYTAFQADRLRHDVHADHLRQNVGQYRIFELNDGITGHDTISEVYQTHQQLSLHRELLYR